MTIRPLRIFPFVAAAMSGFVSSSAPITAMADVIEQPATEERTQAVREAINVDTVGVISPEELLEGSVIITFAGKGVSVDFDISASAPGLIARVDPLAGLEQPSAPNPRPPGYRTAAGTHGVHPMQNVLPARSENESQHYAKHYTAPPMDSGTASTAPKSYDQLQNGDVAPEFKAIYRIASTNVDAVAPWTKPIYRTIDNALQANKEASPPSASQGTVNSFNDNDWFVSRFIKFLLSADSLPYIIFFFIICIVVAGLLRLLRITVPTR